ncbi:uncharacterized protein L201_000618 [Kwoniella dendrophila CBS 6074]|uniref:N-acetyltransferase domain-containing protein n=1 Tax=Kwoniella dendrophila CBS 6074 TaxID=1295534 RepID=A0AAX4JLT7_9TREE
MNLYDINFVFPFKALQTDYVRLEPFIPSKHLEGFLKLPSESWQHLGELGPHTEETALKDIESYRSDSSCLLMAIIDLQVEIMGKDGFAGVYGLIEVDEEYMDAVFGLINILPKYQRTHINTHSMYLILKYLFEDLNMIRVQYDAVVHNSQSINSAKRFGFKYEGICRNLNGLVPMNKRHKNDPHRKSQDMWLASMTDHDWFQSNIKEKFKERLKLPVVDTTKLNDVDEQTILDKKDDSNRGK